MLDAEETWWVDFMSVQRLLRKADGPILGITAGIGPCGVLRCSEAPRPAIGVDTRAYKEIAS